MHKERCLTGTPVFAHKKVPDDDLRPIRSTGWHVIGTHRIESSPIKRLLGVFNGRAFRQSHQSHTDSPSDLQPP